MTAAGGCQDVSLPGASELFVEGGHHLGGEQVQVPQPRLFIVPIVRHQHQRAKGTDPPAQFDNLPGDFIGIAGDHDEARAVLDERLATLAPLELDDLLPPGTGRRMAQDRAARAALLEARVRLGLGVAEALGESASADAIVDGSKKMYDAWNRLAPGGAS